MMHYSSSFSSSPGAPFFLFFFTFICAGVLIGLSIHIWILWMFYRILKAIPEPHRKQTPGFVWLLLIPLAGVIISFFVYPRIADSFRSFFEARGDYSQGEAYRGPALAYCICGCLFWIPYVNMISGIASLVLLIILLVKFHEFKNRVQQVTEQGFPVITALPVNPTD